MVKASRTVAALVGTGIALAFTVCHSARLLHAAPRQADSSNSAPLKEIHVDQRCKVLLDQSDALTGFTKSDLKHHHAICRLASVHTSQHVEETLQGGKQRSKVTIAEREYLLQNVTSEPVAFVVEQPLPENWKIDSDPKPAKIVDATAFFRVSAEPGQIVRLHVGERHANP
jgi:hypothetical protein